MKPQLIVTISRSPSAAARTTGEDCGDGLERSRDDYRIQLHKDGPNFALFSKTATRSFRLSNLGHISLRLLHTYQTDYVEEGAHCKWWCRRGDRRLS